MRDDGVIYVAGHPLLNGQCTELPWRIRLQNDLYCVGCGVELYSLAHPLSLTIAVSNVKGEELPCHGPHGLCVNVHCVHSLCCFVFSFSLPYLSVPPPLTSFTPPTSTAAAAAADDGDKMPDDASGNSADAMTSVMSQIIGQIAAGQIVSPSSTLHRLS